MASFKSPRRGGNVVHRLDFQALSGRRPRRRRLIGLQHDPVADAVPAPRPAHREASAVERPQAGANQAKANPAATNGDQSRRQIDLLERRLEKMVRLLDDRDREIISIAGHRQVEETGVASIYRDVQGVQGRGKEAKQRKEFMSRIFEANLKLQERVRPASPGAE
mgnify:CR=1 FL=1